jgi:hypothetical protein
LTAPSEILGCLVLPRRIGPFPLTITPLRPTLPIDPIRPCERASPPSLSPHPRDDNPPQTTRLELASLPASLISPRLARLFALLLPRYGVLPPPDNGPLVDPIDLALHPLELDQPAICPSTGQVQLRPPQRSRQVPRQALSQGNHHSTHPIHESYHADRTSLSNLL